MITFDDFKKLSNQENQFLLCYTLFNAQRVFNR